MATVPAGMTAGSPVNGVIPLYNSTSGQIAGTMAGGKVSTLDTEANKSAAYAFPSEIGVNAPSAGAGAPGAAAGPQSYLSSSGNSGGSGNMTWNDITNLGYTPQDLAAFQQRGWTPDQVLDSYQKGYSHPAATASVAPQQNAFGVTSVDSGKGYQTLTNAKTGQTVNVDAAGNYFTTDAAGNNTPVSDTSAVSMGFQSANPETNAQKQMAQIDPASEALRTQLAGSYANTLSQAQAPTASQYQSYLDLYKQVDPAGYQQRINQQQQVSDYVKSVTGQAPTSAADALAKYQQLDPHGYASMQALNTSEDASLKQATDQLALGSQLDPTTAKQVEQQTRLAQASRGNVYGTPQMAEEAMTTGQAGLALQAQRQAAAQAAQGAMQSYLTSGATTGALGNQLYQQGVGNTGSALGLQQSYLSSGQDLGSTAMSLYQQGLQNKANAQQSALSYLSSGQTPYQAGASYMNQANANAANAAQGGPVYQPASLGQGNLGTAQQAPQYGLDVGSQAQNYFNSLNNAYGAGAAGGKNKLVGAGVGAASGAVSGAAAGAPLSGATYGASIPIGAAIGAVAGGASGYYS